MHKDASQDRAGSSEPRSELSSPWFRYAALYKKEYVPMYLAGAAAVATVVSIAAFEILMGMTLVALLVTRTKLRFPPVWLPLLLFCLGTLASDAASGHVRAGWPQVKKFYVYLMLFLVVSAFRQVRQVRWVALGWALAATLSAAWGLEQFVEKYQDAQDAHQKFYNAYVADRITGFMGHWMTFSGHMMMALMVIGALLFFCKDRRWNGWLIGAAVLVSVALAAAYTRSMWFGAVGGGLYLLWFWKRWTIIAAPVLAGILLLTDPFQIGQRVISAFVPHRGDLDSNAHRTVLRRIGWEMIKAHPWLGVGPEQVGPQHMNYVPPDVHRPLPTGYYGHLHNVYVHYAAERGVPTMLAMMWMLGRALYDFLRTLRRLPRDSDLRWMLYAAVAVMIAVLIGGLEEVNLGDSEVLAMFFAVLGCGYVAVLEVEKHAGPDDGLAAHAHPAA